MPEVGLIVGASGGIGSACLEQLTSMTSAIVAVSRRGRRNDKDADSDVRWLRADIATPEGRSDVVKAIEESGLDLRYVVFASGVAHRSSIQDASEDDWQRTFAINAIGPGLLVGQLLRLNFSKPASIVFVGSLSARRALPRRAVYGASKAALEQFARVAAVELAQRDIRVNVASLGVTETPFLDGDRQTLSEFVRSRVPAGRASTPQEAAQLVRFLIEGPGTLTGSVVALDGGAGVLG